MDDYFYLPTVDEATVKREKNKARELRNSAWWRQIKGAGVCFYCKRAVGAELITMDHKIPVIRGGKSVKSNVVPACFECNQSKKGYTIDEWEALRAQRQINDEKGGEPPSQA